MSDKSLNLDIEFAYDDVSKGLQDITYAGGQVLKTFLDLGKGIEKAFDQIVKEAKPLITEIQTLGKEANKVFNQVVKDVESIETAIRQADMSPWEKQADKFGQKIKVAQGEVARLQKELQNVNATESERAKVLETISKTQEKIKNLQAGQSKALDLAKLAESSKLAKGIIGDIDKLLNSVGRQIEVVNAAWNTEDMTELERMAAGYAKQIDLAQIYVQKLEERLKNVNLVEADRVKIQQQIATAQQKINSLQEAQGKALDSAKLAADLQVFKSGIAKVDDTIEMVSQHIEEIGKAIRQADMKPWEKAADNYRQHIKAIVADIKQMEAELQSVARTDKERLILQQKIGEAQKRATDLAAMQAIQVQRMRAEEKAQTNKGVMDGGRQGVQEVSTAAGLAGAALTVALTDSAKKFAALDQQMTSFRAITRATNDDVEKFKNTAYSLTILGKSSTEVAALGVELSKAGLTAGEVNRALDTLTKASVAVGEDLNTTGVAIDSVRTQFGLGIEEIERVANGLVLAANESKISVSDLNESYKYLGSTASQANQPLEDVNALLILLGNSGIKASMAGNGLQNSFIRLTDPGVRKALKDIGVEVTDGQGRLKKMTDIIMDLRKALAGASDVNKAGFLKDKFGEVALNPLLALLNQTDTKIKEVRNTALNWSGTLDRVAKDMQQGFNFSLQQMSKSLETFEQQFGESLGPVLIPVFSLLTKLFKLFEDLPAPIKTVISTGAVATAGFLLMTVGIGAAGLVIPGLIRGLGMATNALFIYSTKAPLVASANLTVAESMAVLSLAGGKMVNLFKNLPMIVASAARSMGASAATAAGPWLPFIALAGALYLAWEYNLGGFRDIVDFSIARIQDTFDIFQGWFDGFLTENRVLWEQMWIALQDTLYTVLGIMDAAISGFFDIALGYLTFWTDVFTGNWGKIWNQVSQILKSSTEGMSKSLGHWLEQFGKTFQMGMNGLGEMAAGLWDMLTNPTDMSGGIDRVRAGFETLKKASGDASNFVGKTWNDGLKNIADNAAKIPEAVRSQMDAYRRSGEATVNAAQAAGAQAAAKRKREEEQKKKEAQDPALNAQLEEMMDKGKGKGGESFAEKIIRESQARMEREVSDAMKKFHSEIMPEDSKNLGFKSETDLMNFVYPTNVGMGRGNNGPRSSSSHGYEARDVKVDYNQPVIAAADGTVIYAGEAGGYGKVVVVDHGNGYSTLYAHNSSVGVKYGQAIKQGQKLALSGSTGHSSGPHGHFEIKKTNKTNPVQGAQVKISHNLSAVSSGKISEEAAKEQVSLEKLAQHMARVQAAQDQLGKRTKDNAADWDKLEKEKSDIITKNHQHREKLEKTAADERKKFAEESLKNEKDIAQLQAENAKAQAELGMDSLKGLEGSREEAIKAIYRERDERLRNFKGTAQQLKDLTEAYGQKEVITNKKFDKEILAERERRAQEMLQIDLEYQEEGLKKEQAAVDLRVRREIEGLTKMQEHYEVNGAEWNRLEALKTKATEKGLDDRHKLALDADIANAKAHQDMLNSALTDGQQSFVNALQQMTLDKLNTGQTGFKFEDIQGLAQSLGADSIEGLALNLEKQLNDTKKQLEASKSKSTTKMSESEQMENEAKINGLQKEFESRQRVINALQDSGMTGMVAKYQSLIPEITRANLEQERFLAITDGIGGTLSQLANMFGETGRSIAAGISLVTTTVSTGSQLFASLEAKAKTATAMSWDEGFSIGDLIGTLSAADVSGIASIATTIGSILIGGIQQAMGYDDSIKRMIDARAQYELETENRLAREKLEIRKAAGENVLQEELALIDAETEAQRKKLQSQMDENDKFRFGSGLLGTWTGEDFEKFLNTRLDLDRQLKDLEAKARKEREDAEQKELQRRADAEKASYDRMAETKIMAAQNANDKISEINAQAEKEQADIYGQYLTELLKMAMSGASAEQLTSLQQNFEAKLAASKKKSAEQTRSAKADERKLELESEFDHQESLIGLQDDGLMKEHALLRVQSDRKLKLLDVELSRYEAGSKEYIRLSQQRADAEKETERQIAESYRKSREKRTEMLDDYRNQIATMQASMSKEAVDDVTVGARVSLFEINREEAKARKQAIADFGDDQQVLGLLSEFYAKKRAKTMYDIERNAMDAIEKDYETEQKKKLDAQARPIEAIIKAEERRLREIDKQNAALQRQLDLIDQRYDKELRDFNLRDKSEFTQKVGQIDVRAAMLQGIDYLANTDIQGDPLDRSSKESQRRGLNELLDLREQDAKSRLDLEEISKQQYLAEIEQIILTRAAATQDAMAEAKTDKERADLKKELAEEYIRYQEMQKDKIEELRSAERRQYEDSLRQNNTQRSEIQTTLNVQKEKLEDLNSTYQEKMDAIQLAINDVVLSQDGWLQKLQVIAPVMAETASRVIGNLKAIRDEFQVPLAAAGINIGSSSGSFTGGYTNPFYDANDNAIATQNIPKRSQATTDSDGVFSVTDGTYWYRTTSEMERAKTISNMLGGLPRYATGGDVPDILSLRNDRGLIRVEGGERIKTKQQARAEDYFVSWMRTNGENKAVVNNYNHAGVHIGHISVSRDVDLAKLDAVINKNGFEGNRKMVRRMGPNMMNRG